MNQADKDTNVQVQNEMNNHLFKSQGYNLGWSMTPAERAAFIYIVQMAQADLALEVGSGRGGTSQVISRFCKQAISLDLDGENQDKLKPLFTNIDYQTGDSHELLPKVMEEIKSQGNELGFVFIDGDHTEEGVRIDLEHVLKYRPKTKPLYILCHDSFHPECRQGMKKAEWEKNKNVHYLELDFVSGIFHWSPKWFRYMWGGLALAVLFPDEREGSLVRLEHHHQTFRAVYPWSVHCKGWKNKYKAFTGNFSYFFKNGRESKKE